MQSKLQCLLIGDAMISHAGFEKAFSKHLAAYGAIVASGDFETDWDRLQHRRLLVEQQGPDIEEPADLIVERGTQANTLLGLFIPISKKVMELMPNLRIIGVCRAGLENVNLDYATRHGILVFNVQGRNAHAVSDFTVGVMICECRNIARSHFSIMSGQWRKVFVNSDVVPELGGRTVGLVGFGNIGRLVAKKLAGFEPRILVYDPYCDEESIRAMHAEPADLDTLLKQSDFVSLHARLSDENKNMIGERELRMMKPTAYLINAARAGLVNQNALAKILGERAIMGAALDVFETEPLPKDHPLLSLDNVTLTSHIAGTTADTLTNSPFLLMEDIARLLKGEKARAIANPEVLNDPEFKEFLNSL